MDMILFVKPGCVECAGLSSEMSALALAFTQFDIDSPEGLAEFLFHGGTDIVPYLVALGVNLKLHISGREQCSEYIKRYSDALKELAPAKEGES